MTKPPLEYNKNWPVHSLKEDHDLDIVVEVTSGTTPSTANSEYWNGMISWLTPKEITSKETYRFISKTERTLTKKGAEKAGKVNAVNTVMLTKRAPIGKVVVNKIPMETNQGFLNFRCGKKLLPEFLYYWLTANTSYLKIVANGSTYDELYAYDLFEFKIALPSIKEQQKIVTFLGLFDDEIENLKQINKTLETIAKTFFKNWFIDFEFPRADGKPYQSSGGKMIDNSKFGKIPDGWKVLSISEAFFVNPKRILKTGTMAPYVGMENIPTESARIKNYTRRAFTSGAKFVNGDTLVARITPCLENGKTAYVDFLENDTVAGGSTEFIVLRPKPPIPPEYGYFVARLESFREHAIVNMIGSSGRQRVPEDCLDSFYLAVPNEVPSQFEEIITPILKQIKTNDIKSTIFKIVKNKFLTKLISGNYNSL